METNISNTTISEAAKWIFGGFAQNGVLWFLALIGGIAFTCLAGGGLWVIDKHNAMNPKKKKYFFGGVAILSTLFIGATMIICSMMTSVTRHLNQQVEDMRIAAVGRENRGLSTEIILAGPIISVNQNFTPTNGEFI